MPPTLAAVAALSQLGLRPLTGEIGMSAPVNWVAVSELEDPTPYLEGGELLLTTGMRLDAEGSEPYVTRLVRRGVTGLALGVGLSHEIVPPELVAASVRHGLALLEVPRPTPFIAVGKAVSRLLAAEQYEDVTRAFQAQRELTRAALKGPQALLTRLARELDGWALLLDPEGEVRYAAPESARRRAPELAAELGRGAGVSLSAGDSHVVLQSIGVARRPRGHLAVGTATPLPHVAHTIVGAAASLLSLQTETPSTQRPVRAALATLLLGTGGFEPVATPVRVLACAGGEAVRESLEADPAADRCLATVRDDVCLIIAPDDLATRVAALAQPSGPVGVSDPASLDSQPSAGEEGLRDALAQAEQALAAARHRSGNPVVRYADLPSSGLLSLIDAEAARGFASALLAPLHAEDPQLVESVRAYLAANGQGEAAARKLGIHRHTLRHRMRKASELLNRDLDDPGVRAELWLALSL